MFDKKGTQVVIYTYDTWGKLISTTGSLASTVGAVNPYLYRGYRYDTETGLYYLQSRYYNPDWGRFVNADGIAANTGELLSGNMFAYSKNNPVNMSDADGDRPAYIGETASDVEASVAATSRMLTGRSIARPVARKGSTVNKIVHNVSNVTGSPGGSAALASGDAYVASKVVQRWEKNIFIPRNLSEAAEGGLGALYTATKFSKFTGALSAVGFGVGVWDNFANYKHGWARTAVDVGVFGIGCVIGVGVATFLSPGILAVGICVAGGALLSAGGNAIKDRYFNDPK
ncbi:RHS repeat-associated core domain-containing protein [Clostridium acidisoli DSM 12555]|uniref:RHS repeat-associated core domain-containing protein n=1 Tax=Clostridium acidisoli DSM 12555 TaxID=1121291 RepID=A0A1W1XRY8_9CLOT|nr:RHS repeat-associated core domain-containing protein [Clostridium acidisoli]SMC26740.1 RHS repeat-associated core domain-containing protein [Clostridium acidisoli DSM 12555]